MWQQKVYDYKLVWMRKSENKSEYDGSKFTESEHTSWLFELKIGTEPKK